jgi:hypothetical protein
MTEDERATALRLQRRSVQRLQKAAIEHLRQMVHGDARKARGEALQALWEYDRAADTLATYEAPEAQLSLPALPAVAPPHRDDLLPFENEDAP